MSDETAAIQADAEAALAEVKQIDQAEAHAESDARVAAAGFPIQTEAGEVMIVDKINLQSGDVLVAEDGSEYVADPVVPLMHVKVEDTVAAIAAPAGPGEDVPAPEAPEDEAE